MQRPLTPRHHPDYRYPGLRGDPLADASDIGAIIRDAWVLGLLAEDDDCRGWPLARIRRLRHTVTRAWLRYDHRVSRLPPALHARYLRIHGAHARRARQRGWQPLLDTD